jgi:acetylornithine deacetylase/succinyl-diaminopimelate desuccinylase-like protein
MERHRDRLRVDAWLVADGPVHASRRPQLVFGVRGVTGLELTVYGPVRALHSGHYGNWAPNPAARLAGLVASMAGDDGRVTIPGFYETTRAPTAAEREAIARLPDTDAALRRELGLGATDGAGRSLAEAILEPALNVRGLEAGRVGDAATNSIPAEATASIDLRLAPGNDPRAMLDLVERHVRAQGYHVVDREPDLATRLGHLRLARIERQGGYPAVRTPLDAPGVAAIVAAAEAAATEPPVLVPTLGGSLPLHLLQDSPERVVVIVPIANHDDNQHAADENLRLANLWYGIDLFAALLRMPAGP